MSQSQPRADDGADTVPAAKVDVDTKPAAKVDVVGRHRKLVFRTALISSLTLMSRIVGFARETLAASIFGDHSPVNDAFVTAWRVPNLFRSLLGEGAMTTSLTTAITKADAEEGEEGGRRLFLAIVRVLAWILLGVCAVVMIGVHFMPDTMPITGFRWLGSYPEPVRELTVRMMPFVVLVCLSAVASGALNVRGHYLSPSLAPVVMNLWWITSLFIVAGMFGWSRAPGASDADEFARQFEMTRWLAWFVLVAGLILLVMQIPALQARGLLFKHRGDPVSHAAPVPAERVWSVLKSTAPLALGAAVYQINVMIDGFMALSLLPDGGPTTLYYATRIQQFPMSLISIAATSAVFPALTALGHQRSLSEVRALHDRTHIAIAFVALPASVGLLFFAEPIVAACFHRGQFGAEGVVRTAEGLRFLTLAILPAGAAGLVARTYYAMGDFKTPVKISVAMLAANVAFNFTFVAVLGMDIGGLALATALTSWGNLMLLLPGLERRLGLPPADRSMAGRLTTIGLAAAGSCLPARGLYAVLATEQHSSIALALSIAVSCVLYGLSAQWLGIPEWRHMTARFRSRRGSAS